MSDSRHDGSWMHDKTPPPATYAVAVAEAIREASYRIQRMQLAREVPERLDTNSLAAVGAALEDITRGAGAVRRAGRRGAARFGQPTPDGIPGDPRRADRLPYSGTGRERRGTIDRVIRHLSLQRRGAPAPQMNSAADPDQAFLHHAGDQPAIPAEEPPGGQPPPSCC